MEKSQTSIQSLPTRLNPSKSCGYTSNNCEIPRDCGYGIGTWGWLVAFILILFALTVLIWVILYSKNPSWVQTGGSTDTGKVLLWSLIIAFVISLILVLLKYLYNRYCCKSICIPKRKRVKRCD